MNAKATNLQPELVTQEIAEVVRVDGSSVTVATALRRFVARRATSCVLTPVAGDVVLVAVAERGAFVLAILDGRGTQRRELETEGDLSIRSREGAVTIAAKDAVKITSEDEITAAAGGPLSLISGRDARLVSEALSIFVEFVDVDVGRVRTVARTIETLAEQCVRRVKRAFSFIEEIDHVHADRFEVSAGSSARIHADHTTVTAKTLVKVDGAQVHIG